MIDKITSKIKRYPFQTGILVGFAVCLILIGFINLFQDNGRTLSGNTEIIQEDYLRMTMNEFSGNRDPQLAAWRYDHLGKAGDETLKLMAGDDSLSPWLIAEFAEAVDKENVFRNGGSDGTAAGTPVKPKKGLSAVGITLLVILGLIVISAGALYLASLVKTRKKQKMRAERSFTPEEEALNVITPEKARNVASDSPDTLFDLDELFPQKSETEQKQENDPDVSIRLKDIPAMDNETPEEEPVREETAADDEGPENDTPAEPEEIVQDSADSGETEPDPEPVAEELFSDDADETEDETEEESAEMPEAENTGLDIETSVHDIGEALLPDDDESDTDALEMSETEPAAGSDEDQPGDPDADKPLVETDIKTDPNSDDELLQMIRSSKTNSDVIQEKGLSEEAAPEAGPDADAEEDPEQNENPAENNDETDEQDGILIHYQSTYRIGNDMYDEVFSIDQGDVFRGECGIGIGETLNNTEPKAVTAFEVWLFDKDDIHTTTWYLMSDFALSNEGIAERLLQHGKCERIRKNGKYTLETETLAVDITVLELEYGTEMEEKNSYFTNVTFDVVARNKN